jgi:poly-gamma-glutamate capsule biosynthesis protein CapA/YwtB (metallophosphatase superfamily)
VNHENVLALARQGDAGAIALLINQALVTRGVQVRAIRKDSSLHVLLEAAQIPPQQTYTRVVYAATLCLGASSIRSVQVYGRQSGTKSPAWAQTFVLRQAQLPEIRPEKPTPAFSTATPADLPIQAPEATEVGLGLEDKNQGLGAEIKSRPPATLRRRKRRRAQGSLPSYPRPRRLASAASLRSPQPSPAPRLSLLDPKLGLPIALVVCASFTLGAGLNLLFKSSPESVDRTASAKTAAPQNLAAAALIQPSPAVPLDKPVLTLKAVGDIIPGTNFPADRLPDSDGQFLFNDVKPFLGEADIVFGNFESTLTDYPYAAKDISQGMTFAFRTPPAYAKLLRQAGFNMLNIANNHSLDFSDQGLADTIANIEQAGMKVVGKKGDIAYMTVNNIPVAFIGFGFLDGQNSITDLATAGALVREAKKQAKIVVVSAHAGAEGTDAVHTSDQTEFFFGENRGNLVSFAHSMIDQGADLFLGHGPHVPRSLELYKSKLIAYSLGNFMGYRTLSTDGTLGDSLILQVQLNAQGNFTSGRIIPIALDANGVPRLDDYFNSVVLIRNLIETDFPTTPLLIDDKGFILKNEAQPAATAP